MNDFSLYNSFSRLRKHGHYVAVAKEETFFTHYFGSVKFEDEIKRNLLCDMEEKTFA